MTIKQEMQYKQADTKYEVKIWLMKWNNLQDCIDGKYAASWWTSVYDKTTEQGYWLCFEWPLKDLILLDRADIMLLKWKWVKNICWCYVVPRKPREWKRFEEIKWMESLF